MTDTRDLKPKRKLQPPVKPRVWVPWDEARSLIKSANLRVDALSKHMAELERRLVRQEVRTANRLEPVPAPEPELGTEPAFSYGSPTECRMEFTGFTSFTGPGVPEGMKAPAPETLQSTISREATALHEHLDSVRRDVQADAQYKLETVLKAIANLEQQIWTLQRALGVDTTRIVGGMDAQSAQTKRPY